MSLPPTPKTSAADVAQGVIKAAISAVPYLGAPLAELLQLVVRPAIDKRTAEWMDAVGQKLVELEAAGKDLSALTTDPIFIDVALQATQAAIRTSSAEKRLSLRNAVINVASGQSVDETVAQMLLRFVDELTAMHLRILALFSAPKPPPGMSVGGLSNVLERGIPDLMGCRDIYDQLWRDLYIRGLVNTEHLHVTMTSTGLGERRTTRLGEDLLVFIAEPQTSISDERNVDAT